MSIQISNAAAQNVNWESILSSLGSVEKADKVDSKQNFTITTTVDGQTRTMTVSVPDDLEIPETVDQGTLEGLIDKLKGAFNWIKAHYDLVNKICGGALVLVGVLMATGTLGRLLSILS